MIILDDMSNIFCNFVQIDNRFECSRCGTVVSFSDGMDPPLFPCRNPLLGTSEEVAKNVVTVADQSQKLASAQEIEQRHKICLGCEFLQNNTCTQCGCNIIRDRVFMNKLAHKTESCPVNKW
jgi:hypothetical protein